MLHNTLLKYKRKWTAKAIYDEVENIIKAEYSSIPDKWTKIPQLDLYKIWHYDNSARRTSLKWLEFAMRLENVEDLPYEPGTYLTSSQMDHIIGYCDNDIDATEEFYNKSLDNIEFRKQMSKELNHNVINYSDVKIGEYINQKTYEKISNRDYFEFKNKRTYRKSFNIKELIPNFIKYKSNYLNKFLDEIKNVSFNSDEDFVRNLKFAGIELTFAKGGLHSKDKSLDIKCNKDEILQEKDVGSMYPASIINGKLFPKHLGKEWYLGIKHLFDIRSFNLKPKLKTIDKSSSEYKYINSKQNAYKLGMNGGGYGKTGSEYSWQYDPMVIMKTTFKGQLALIMLIEQLYDVGCNIISANTDGVVIKYSTNIKSKVLDVHKKWEKTTNYILEDTNYSRIVFRDVNNFVAFICDENKNHLYYKFKGAFEIDRDYHKNHSKRIVAIAVANYFINNISPETTINNHLKGWDYDFAKNYGIYDFCIGAKMTGKNKLYKRTVKGVKTTDDKLYKVTRYYVSNKGSELIKKLPPLEKNYLTNTEKIKQSSPNQLDIFDIVKDVKIDPKERETNIEAGWLCTVFNKYMDKKEAEYNINYKYYILEAYKIINKII